MTSTDELALRRCSMMKSGEATCTVWTPKRSDQRSPVVRIATDGSWLKPKGYTADSGILTPCAAGFVVEAPDGRTAERIEPQPDGKIGTMELRALRLALDFASAFADENVRFEILCDAKWVVCSFRCHLEAWADNGFKKNGGLAHREEWLAVHRLRESLAVDVVWVKAHSKIDLNERCDRLVNASARSQKAVDTVSLVFEADVTSVPPAAETEILTGPLGDFDPPYRPFSVWRTNMLLRTRPANAPIDGSARLDGTSPTTDMAHRNNAIYPQRLVEMRRVPPA